MNLAWGAEQDTIKKKKKDRRKQPGFSIVWV